MAQALGLPNHNVLRYVAPTGTLLMRWEGARTPLVWSVPAPDMEPLPARLEMARRYLHVFGPSTAAAFAKWAGIGRSQAAHAIRGPGAGDCSRRAVARWRGLDPRRR